MSFELHTYTAPSHWASYLINDDCSGLDDDDIIAADKFISWLRLGAPVDCTDDVGFMTFHDARPYSPLAADCFTYTFLLDTSALTPQIRHAPTN